MDGEGPATQQDEGSGKSYGLDRATLEDLARRFTYHPPKNDQPARYTELRSLAHGLAHAIATSCPSSRERSLALTKLEEAVMWANAAIARNE